MTHPAQQEKTTMIRKFVLAAAAIAALGTVSLTASTTPAAAWGKGGGFHSHHFHGGGFRVYSGIGLYGSCLRTRWVVNRFGNLVPRTVNICY
jgi:hypothetical protein